MNKEKEGKRQKERENDREKRETKRIAKLWGNCLLDHESSVEVGYGFMLFRSKLLIANDMYWVIS